MNIKKAVKVALAQKGLAYSDLAKRMGVSTAYLYNLSPNVTSKTMQSIAEALGMKASELVALGEDQ